MIPASGERRQAKLRRSQARMSNRKKVPRPGSLEQVQSPSGRGGSVLLIARRRGAVKRISRRQRPPSRETRYGAGYGGLLPGAGVGADAGALGFAVGEGAGVGSGVASKAGSQDWFCARPNGSPYSVNTRLSEPSGDIVNRTPSWAFPLYTAIMEPSGDQDGCNCLIGLSCNFTSVLKPDPSALTTLIELEPDMSSFVPSGDHATSCPR